MQDNNLLSTPITKEVLLDAPVSKVWSALTKKEELKQWCFDMEAFEPVEGFEFHFYGEKDGEKFKHNCRVLRAIPGQEMKWLWSYENVPGDTYVTFYLQPEGEKTRLTLTHEGLEKLPQDNNYSRENFVAGWNEIIGNLLPAHLEK